jgi:hypothetical protein
MLVYSSSTERAQQAALMVRPRRLSDSSVSSACSENETNYGNIPGISANALPHVRSQNDRVESRSYVCSRSGSNASNAGISSSSNVNKNVRMDHQNIAGGSLRISSTSTSANNGKANKFLG